MSMDMPSKGRKFFYYLYLTIFSAAGLGLAGFLIFEYVAGALVSADEIVQLAVLTLVLTLSRSLTLPTRKGQGIDISMIIIYAALILKGIYVTAFIITVSTLFTVIKWDNKNVSHIFNTPISRTLFNNSNHIISVCLGWLVFVLAGNVPFDQAPDPYNVLGILLPSILFFFVTILINSVNMFTVLKLSSADFRFFPSIVSGVSSMLPTLLAFAPIGYFLAIIFNLQYGPYMALLFIIPLLFARFAFKLYLDSKEQYLRTISTLTAAIEAKDEYTEGHSKRVAQYAVDIAQAMGLRSSRVENIKVASVLHDIGKIGIDDKILRKPSKLTKAEWSRIIEHPAIGVKILEEVTMPEAVKEMIFYHHVRYDRGGYPEIGKDVKIPLEVHIIGLADAFDAMTSNRPYRSAMTEKEALDIIEQEKGKQFHPDVVDVFLRLKNRK
jgi:putative nucleotidyltransferase with HDIG domain